MTFKEFIRELPRQMIIQWQANRPARQLDQITDDLNFLKSVEGARMNNENIFDRKKK